MCNILDYVDWRGDLEFKNSPFNEVDNLILSCLSYLDFDEIANSEQFSDAITISDAAEKYFKKYNTAYIYKTNNMLGSISELFYKTSISNRFKNLKMWNYKNILNYDEKLQFSAITFQIDENTFYIAFRGTDNSLIGWQEDFNMSFMHTIPAQKNALEYILKNASKVDGKFIIGGHSKGGNLAVYSLIKCGDNIQDRILKVYNNDGPGFDEDIIQSEEYLKIVPKINTIVPESSIIGMLLEHSEQYTVIESSGFWIFQHNPISWKVKGNLFIHKSDIKVSEKLIDKSIKNWLKSMSEDERKHFITSLFEILESTGAKTIDDLAENGIKNISLIKKSFLLMDGETKIMTLKLIIKILEIIKIKVFN